MNAAELAEIVGVVALSGLAAFGGGNGLVAVIQNHWVSTGELDAGLFAWIFAVSHLFPGPRAGFAAGVGYYLRGIPGAVAAAIGAMIPACVSSALLSYGMGRVQPVIRGIALPASFVIAGLIAAAAWNLAIPLHLGPAELAAALAVAWLAGPRDVEPLWLILGALGTGLVWMLVR